jgi:hypothetical protein
VVVPVSIRRLLVGAGSALVAVGLAACGGPDVALVGTVTDAYTGSPVPAAVVQVDSQNATADSNGKYELTRWNAKSTLQVSADGYAPTSIDLASQAHLQQAQPPSVTLDATIRPDSLSGTIKDAYSAEPLAGASIKVSDTISATTAADGSYRLTGLPESFTLEVSAPNYAATSKSLERTTSFDLELRPTILRGVLTNLYTGEPVSGATVSVGDRSASSDANGAYELTDIPLDTDLVIAADGYATITEAVAKAVQFDATLRPDTLTTVLVDKTTGEPIANATLVASETITGTSDIAFARIDNSSDGTISIKGIPEKGFLKVLAPGYLKQVIPLEIGNIPAKVEMEPFQVKGIYVTAAVAANWDLLMKYFDFIDQTELNAIVMDLKSDLRDDLGLVYYDSQTPLVKELGTSYPYIDYEKVLAEAKRRGIYTIARTHIFSHDNVLAEAKPEWAAQDRVNGGIFYDYPTPTIKYAWLDPWNKNVWEYNRAIAVEAAQMGFDEVNYDYIRFPSLEFAADDKIRLQLSKDNSTPEERYANIAEVLKEAQRDINGAGAYLSIDVFGYTAWRPDALIGQDIGLLSEYTDYIMPMIYPSHFNPGELGFDNPSNHPYEIIKASMEKGETQVVGQRAHLRPWLQDFTLTWVPASMLVEYDAAKVRAQIQAVKDVDPIMGWILYNSANIYTDEAVDWK